MEYARLCVSINERVSLCFSWTEKKSKKARTDTHKHKQKEKKMRRTNEENTREKKELIAVEMNTVTKDQGERICQRITIYHVDDK